MAAKEREEDMLSEDQRLSQLERTVSLNRIISMLVAVVLIIAISVGVTILIVHSMNEGPTNDHRDQLARLELEVTTLRNELQTNRLQVEQLQKELPNLKLRLDNSSAATFQKVLIQQEIGYQQFLNTLKTGMADLAHMVQGSRTWLEHYNEELNKGLQSSLSRQKQLQRLQTGSVLIEPDAQLSGD